MTTHRTLIALVAIATAACGTADVGSPDSVEQDLSVGDQLRLRSGGIIDIGTNPMIGADFNFSTAHASFWKNLPSNCNITNVGLGCAVYDCPQPGPHHVPNVDAGTITVTGGASPITLTPTGSTYALGTEFSPSPVFFPGNISVKAAGGDLTPFTISGLRVPNMVHVTTPLLTNVDGTVTAPRLHVSRSADLPVEWTGGADSDWFSFNLTDQVGTYVQSSDDSGSSYVILEPTHSRSLQCLVRASTGRFVIPKAAFASFAAGSETAKANQLVGTAGRNLTILVSTERRGWALARTGITPILVEAKVHSPLSSTGSQAQWEVTIQ